MSREFLRTRAAHSSKPTISRSFRNAGFDDASDAGVQLYVNSVLKAPNAVD